MARFARIVVPGVPHHVTQRGVRRMNVFFSDRDYRRYLQILGRKALEHDLSVWAYCLMPNHVHLVVVPATQEGLARPLGQAHHRYAVHVNRQYRWTGHLWQERFSSFPMDEPHLMAAVRYVLLNPVRAGLVQEPTEWPYSSARAHVLEESDPLVDCTPCAERISDWGLYLGQEEAAVEEARTLRGHGRMGRPLGSDQFIDRLERLAGRSMRPQKAGRKAARRAAK